MQWTDLVEILGTHVPAGRVTTYGDVSQWAYGRPDRNQPVRSLLLGAANHGHVVLTNRVVTATGDLADLPEGRAQQLDQLRSEGVAFTPNGKVDFSLMPPVSWIELKGLER